MNAPAVDPAHELVIFDCDGVLVDSEPIANRVLAARLGAAGLALSVDEVMRRFVGRTREGCLALAAELLGKPLPPDFGDAWDAALFKALGSEVRAIEGVADLIGRLHTPFCVASNSGRERMRLSLGITGLLQFFEGRMFSAADVARPKPAPDLFLHAASAMETAPARCVVIEDTPTGVRAGVAAGMTVLGYAGGAHSDSARLEAEGARVFRDMASVAAWLASGG